MFLESIKGKSTLQAVELILVLVVVSVLFTGLFVGATTGSGSGSGSGPPPAPSFSYDLGVSFECGGPTDSGSINPFYPMDCPINLTGNYIMDSEGPVKIIGKLQISEVGEFPSAVVTRGFMLYNFVERSGDTMWGPLNMAGNGILNAGPVTGVVTEESDSPDTGANKKYVDAVNVTMNQNCNWRESTEFGDHNVENMCPSGKVARGIEIDEESTCSYDVLYGKEGCVRVRCCTLQLETGGSP